MVKICVEIGNVTAQAASRLEEAIDLQAQMRALAEAVGDRIAISEEEAKLDWKPLRR